MAKFKINASVVIAEDLEVKGRTTTKDQETLKVKDNVIMTNSGGVSIINNSGLIIKNGEPGSFVKGVWTFNIDIDLSALKTKYGEQCQFNLNFHVLNPKQDVTSGTEDYTGIWFNALISGESAGIERMNFLLHDGSKNETQLFSGGWVGIPIYVPQIDLGNEFQAVDADLYQFLLTNATTTSTDNYKSINSVQAYAAPVYNPTTHSLQLGQGYVDENGDFEFNTGDGQSLATRADNIPDGNLVKWNAQTYRIEDSGVSPIKNRLATYSGSTPDYNITLEDNARIIFDGVVASINISLPTGNIPLDFMCELVIGSGGLSAISYPTGIEWSGTDVSYDGTKTVFTPNGIKPYNILFFNNGSSVSAPQWQAIVRGATR